MSKKLVKPSKARKRWLIKGANKATLTAVQEMTCNSIDISRSVKATRSGGTRYSAGKFPIEVRAINS